MLGLFLLLQLAPGDAVDALMGQMGSGDAALAERLRHAYGLEGSVMARLAIYFWHLVRFDLGNSAAFDVPVAGVIFSRLPVTLLLMTTALSFAFAAGTGIGILAARRVNRWPDTLISTLGLIFYATPSFWFGLMGILVFSVKLNWLPAGGLSDLGAAYSGGRYALDVAVHLLLPAATLALDLSRDLPAHHARLDAGGDDARFRAYRPRQGLARIGSLAMNRACVRSFAERVPIVSRSCILPKRCRWINMRHRPCVRPIARHSGWRWARSKRASPMRSCRPATAERS